MLIQRTVSAFHRLARGVRHLVPNKLYSVVVCSIDDRRFEKLTASLARSFGNHAYEVVRIDNARSMCQGYNEGLKRSRGNRLIFCHDDIEILSDDFVSRIESNFAQFDVFGLVGTTRLTEGSWSSAGPPDVHGAVVQPHRTEANQYVLHVFSNIRKPVANAQALDGMLIAARRETAQDLGWDEENISGFHLYDVDFSFRAHLAGLKVGIATDLLVYHASQGTRDETWRKAVVSWTMRYAEHLSTAPHSKAEYRAAICPNLSTAYQSFRELVDAAESATNIHR